MASTSNLVQHHTRHPKESSRAVRPMVSIDNLLARLAGGRMGCPALTVVLLIPIHSEPPSAGVQE